MIYATVTVIVDGTLEEEHICYSQEEIQAFVGAQGVKAAMDGLPTQIWVLAHDHEQTEEEGCVCIQYLSDHAPYCTFNVEEEHA